MTRNVLIPISSDSDFEFFALFENGLRQLGYRLIFLTNKVSLFIRSKSAGIQAHVVTRNTDGSCDEDLSRTADVFMGHLSGSQARELYLSFYNTAKEIATNGPIELIFFWNGSQSPQNLAVKRFAKVHGIRTLFFEAPNIERKLFVDPRGVNAESFIYNNIQYLRTFAPDPACFDAWRRDFIETKKKRPVPPQAKINKGINNLLFPLDIAAFSFLPIPKSGNANFLKKMWEKTGNRLAPFKYDSYELERSDFVFYPMQVRWDTQLLVNSSHSNLTAIAEAAKIANSQGLTLLVKPHPAESDFSERHDIMEAKERYHFLLVNYPSIRLVQHAKLVVTINSSVGLEALLLDRPIRFLGKSLYERLDRDLLMRYVCSYLVDIDKYSREPVKPEMIEKVLQFSYLKPADTN